MQPKLIGEGRFALLPDKPRSGGTAQIYKAADLHNGGRTVAVKVFGGTILEDEFVAESFLRETESLSSLKHENIVELVTSGFDTTLGKYYVVLEWVEQNLPQFIKQTALEDYGWDTFADNLLLPILKGLAFAHGRNVLHRDIKPVNILVRPDGTPMLADFGIAKLVDSLRIGVTVQHFGSMPYAPSERGMLPPSPREDLFSLGLTALHCLIAPLQPSFIISHTNLDQALEEADLPTEAERFIRKLISFDPEQRPYSGSVALAELERIQHPRTEREKPRLYLALTRKPTDDLKTRLRCRTNEDVHKAMLKDLSGRTAIRLRPSSTGDDLYQLIGEEFSYHLKVDKQSVSSLVVLSVSTEMDVSHLERDRENACPLYADFLIQSPSSLASARSALEGVLYEIAQFDQQQKLGALREEEKRIYRLWENILQAMTDLDLTRKQPLSYRSVHAEGRRAIFDMISPLEESLIGKPRRVACKRLFAGIVIDILGSSLVLALHKGDSSQIPAIGQLIIDQSASETSLQRQRRALQQVQYEQCVRPDLGSLLIHPENTQVPLIIEEITPQTKDFDLAKCQALNTALYSPDITLVQGPPGTGKTTWIAELVYQYLKLNPGKKILLASQTHSALDNALEKIEKLLPASTLVRIGTEENVADEMDHHRLDQRVLSWGKSVHNHARENLKSWAETHGISELFLRLNANLEAIQEAQQQQYLAQRHADELAILLGAEQESSRNLRTAISLEQAAERYLEMFEYVRNQLESRLRAADMEDLRYRYEREILLLTPLLDKENVEGMIPNGDTMRAQADVVFQRTDEMEKMLQAVGLLNSTSPLQPAVGAFIDIGITLASHMESVSALLTTEENRFEYARCIKQALAHSDAIRNIKIEIAGLSGLSYLANAETSLIEAEVGLLLTTVSSDDVKQYYRLHKLQQEWLLRFGAGEGFEGALLSLADVVAGTCVGFASVDRLAELSFDLVIIDEASKATPTEALIAMSRGKQWVLVGDDKQLPPFIDSTLEQEGHLAKYELTREDLQRTLFDRLLGKRKIAHTFRRSGGRWYNAV